ncbi:hypothetical protein E2C01_093073 [Portunus trituberculatus]|uniref:Uncharacterized protein n=1 Tax=Portunus trituberculatus TaxID=210409 RepID=A0A5B7JZK8_PORTR|nr:hypothetical protein [Portunus trituberculatus]
MTTWPLSLPPQGTPATPTSASGPTPTRCTTFRGQGQRLTISPRSPPLAVTLTFIRRPTPLSPRSSPRLLVKI